MPTSGHAKVVPVAAPLLKLPKALGLLNAGALPPAGCTSAALSVTPSGTVSRP
jgi:hypothetical protein